jgi:hypothetical protein
MPQFAQDDKTAFRTLAVHFANQAALDDFLAKLERRVTPKTRQLWFPEQAVETYVDKQYKAEA